MVRLRDLKVSRDEPSSHFDPRHPYPASQIHKVYSKHPKEIIYADCFLAYISMQRSACKIDNEAKSRGYGSM